MDPVELNVLFCICFKSVLLMGDLVYFFFFINCEAFKNYIFFKGRHAFAYVKKSSLKLNYDKILARNENYNFFFNKLLLYWKKNQKENKKPGEKKIKSKLKIMERHFHLDLNVIYFLAQTHWKYFELKNIFRLALKLIFECPFRL